MPNILINPNSGIIEFSTGVAGDAIFDANITTKSNLLENQLHSAVFYTNNRWLEPYIVTKNNKLYGKHKLSFT